MKNPGFPIWIGWMGATVAAAMCLSAFAFTTFQTKDEAKDSKQDIVQRLERIEQKLDETLIRHR